MTVWIPRKTVTTLERVSHDGGPVQDVPLKRGAIGVVVKNPFAGRYADEDELVPAMEALRPLALELAEELVAALGGAASIETFSKGAIVGAMGEMEHGAMWHAPGGAAIRKALGDAKAQVPAAKKVGAVGAVLDMPLHYIHASMVRSHYDAMSFSIPDGPKPDELVFILAADTGGRIHARLGGLAKEHATTGDGLT